MTICGNCGEVNSDDSIFCFKCGVVLNKQSQSPSGVVCPKCHAVMRAGFIVERDSPMSLWTVGSGVYWTPDEGGSIGSRLALKAYACPQCGYIEQYIRYLEKDRNVIERAPTRFSQ